MQNTTLPPKAISIYLLKHVKIAEVATRGETSYNNDGRQPAAPLGDTSRAVGAGRRMFWSDFVDLDTAFIVKPTLSCLKGVEKTSNTESVGVLSVLRTLTV